MVLKGSVATMISYPCKCGGRAERVVGTVAHKIGQKRILIHDVPHLYCSNCNSIEYDITEVKVMPILKEALKMGQSEIYWKENK